MLTEDDLLEFEKLLESGPDDAFQERQAIERPIEEAAPAAA